MDVQFIAEGPGIPDELLREHEGSKVVFFCGAGISCNAGIPTFNGLTKQVANKLQLFEGKIKKNFSDGHFDYALGKLEQLALGGKHAVRESIHKILSKPLTGNAPNTTTHHALVQLATTRNGNCHLVTTNFDRLFELATASSPQIEKYQAPLLPIPRDGEWNGIVYLHGLSPKNYDEFLVNKLVYTNSDFGRAYLTDGWAARFISELLRNYTICFIGYSLSDPLLRYMFDAIPPSSKNKVYAFADYDDKKFLKETVKQEWEDKGVIPILFDSHAAGGNYRALHDTLGEWAKHYTEGFNAKENIIRTEALRDPSTNSTTDDFVDRVVWALSDESGIPAKIFASLVPSPSLKWLPILGNAGLLKASADNTAQTITTHCPPSLYLSAQSYHLAHWILKHLNSPLLLAWFIEEGFYLNDQFLLLLSNELGRLEKLNPEQIQKQLKDFPDSIPQGEYVWIWHLIANGFVTSHQRCAFTRDLARIHDIDDKRPLSESDKLNIGYRITPIIEIKKDFRFDEKIIEPTGHDFTRLFSVDLEFRDDCASTLLDHRFENITPERRVELLPYLDNALTTGLNLLTEANGGEKAQLEMGFYLPAIETHEQNLAERDWAKLVRFIAYSWLSLDQIRPDDAVAYAQKWMRSSHPVLKRVALFAAANGTSVKSDIWIPWLIENNGKNIFDHDLKHEIHRLIDQKSATLTKAQLNALCRTLLADHHQYYRSDISDEDYRYFEDRTLFYLLKKIHLALPAYAQNALARIQADRPELRLDKWHKEEFSGWVTGTGHADFEESKQHIIVPSSLSDLVKWLKEDIDNKWNDDHFYTVHWSERCKENPDVVSEALDVNATEGPWNAERWGDVLWAWRQGDDARRMAELMKKHFDRMDETTFGKLKRAMASWAEAYGKAKDCDKNLVVKIAAKVLAHELSEPANPLCEDLKRDITMAAINHPAGYAIGTLLTTYFNTKRERGEKLKEPLLSVLNRCCKGTSEAALYARHIIFSWSNPIYYVDPAWYLTNLRPFLTWKSDTVNSIAAWKGFLWSNNPASSLVEDIKLPILSTTAHYSKLESSGPQFCALALRAKFFSMAKLPSSTWHKFFNSFPQKGYEDLAHVLQSTQRQTMNPAEGEKGDPTFWQKKIKPFILHYWPKRPKILTPKVRHEFVELVLESNKAFPDAFKTLKNYLAPLEHAGVFIYQLKDSDLCSRFPCEACAFANMLIKNISYCGGALKECLDQMKNADPTITKTPAYKRLYGLYRASS